MSVEMHEAPVKPFSFRMELPVEAVSIAISRSVIRRVVAFLSDDAESSFLVALTEIVANALEAHQRCGITLPIVLDVDGTVGLVKVIDQGGGLDNTHPVEVDRPDGIVNERGRGLALARAFVEDLGLESDEHGTTAILPLGTLGTLR